MIGRRQIELHQFKERLEETLGLPACQAVNRLDYRHSLNRQVGISGRSARLSGQFISHPIGNRLGADPNWALIIVPATVSLQAALCPVFERFAAGRAGMPMRSSNHPNKSLGLAPKNLSAAVVPSLRFR